MEQEKIVLPKFTVPGQTNWVKWVLVGVGGMVALSVIAFTIALSQRDTAPSATATAAPAKADVPLAPSATPRPVPQPRATLAATTIQAPDTAPRAEPTRRVKGASHQPRRRAHGSSRALAKASSSSSSKSSGKPDALDEILKRFK